MINKDASADWKILRAGKEDLAEIAELAGCIWRAHYPGIITPEQIDYMLSKMFDEQHMRHQLEEGMVYDRLILGDRCIGFSAHGPKSSSGEYHLDKLYVLETFRRRGFGRAMIQHIFDEARSRGLDRVILNVNKRNRQAIEAYRRSGFTIREPVVADIGGGFVMDDYVMERRL